MNIMTPAIPGTRVARAPTPEESLSPRELETKEAFTRFVGTTFYSQMLSAMRKTVDPPEYFHGGQAEETFQVMFDLELGKKLTEASADRFAGPMFELFLARSRPQ